MRVEDIDSITPWFVKQILEKSERPDNFLDSPNGSFVGLPNIDVDPEGRQIVRRLEDEITEIGKTAVQILQQSNAENP